MTKKGSKERESLAAAQRDFPSDYSSYREAELAKTIEILTKKLRLMETKTANLSIKDSSEEEATDTIDCSFVNTCYTAKNKMGPYPCELRR
jgi:hypothetical protein